MLQELREAPAHPEIPDGRKLAELGQYKDLFDPILAPLVSPELENAHGEGSGGTFSLGISAQGLLVSSVEPEE